jgi:hypothetical protein
LAVRIPSGGEEGNVTGLQDRFAAIWIPRFPWDTRERLFLSPLGKPGSVTEERAQPGPLAPQKIGESAESRPEGGRRVIALDLGEDTEGFISWILERRDR